MWHIFQNPQWGRTGGEEEEGGKTALSRKKPHTFDKNLDTFITCTVPVLVLRSRNKSMKVQITARASTGEQQRVKWNILHYHQGSPLHLKSSALPLFHRLCATTAYAPPRERTHVNVHTHAQAHTYTQPGRRNKKKGKRRGEETRFGMSLSVFYSYIILFCGPPLHGRKQGHWSRVWCDTLLRPLFCTTPANMQAHLSRALKPSLILWRPKHFNFFQQTSSQLALDCQWGSPNSKIYHLETHKSPLRQIFPFKASQKRKKRKRTKKRERER